MFFYNAYGLAISSDIAIPELTLIESISCDVHIRQSQPHELFFENKPESFIQGNATQLLLTIPHVADFLIEEGRRIIYRLCNTAHVDEFRLFLLGSCFGALLQQRGFLVLHGNAISLNENLCTIFVGEQGAGKSTTAAWFMQQGATILSDDVCAITFNDKAQPIVIPGVPQIKLWQESADKLKIDTTPLRRVRPQDAKYALSIREIFQTTPFLIKEIVELKKNAHSEKLISGFEKLKTLIEHSYRYSFLAHQNAESAYTKQLMCLAKQVSLKSVGREALFTL